MRRIGLWAWILCLVPGTVGAVDFEGNLRSAYSSIQREFDGIRDRKSPAEDFDHQICGRAILEGAFLHDGIILEVDGLPIRAITDINGYYCFSDTFEGTRNVVAWKHGWSANQISHVLGSPGQRLPTIVLHGPPDEVLASLYVEQYGHLMWISASRSTQAARMEHFEQYRDWWIGGIVREDAANELGFYFQADTVVIAQFTAEERERNFGLQTTIPELAEDPTPHIGRYRYVAPRFLKYKDLRLGSEIGPARGRSGEVHE